MPTGTLLGGRYLLARPLGAGSSATVYLAEDRSLRREVAVKVLRTGLTADDGFLKRFRAEAVAVAGLNHPHVLRVFDWGEADGGAWLVAEYLAGGSLRELLDRRGPLPLEEVVSIGAQAADGLAYAHTRGFVHRDVKPTNLLFDDAGRVRITDFGVARALAEATWTEPTGLIGTVRYSSPEQALGRRVDPKTDVYSLALVLYECTTGVVPFVSDSQVATLHARVGAPLPPHESLGPLADVLVQAAAPDPRHRLDAQELWGRLTEVAKSLPDPSPVRSPRQTPNARAFKAPSPEELTGPERAIASSSRPRGAGDLAPPVVIDDTVHAPVDATLVGAPPIEELAPAPAVTPGVEDLEQHPDAATRRSHRARWAFTLVVAVALAAAGVAYASRSTPIVTFAMPDVRGVGLTTVEGDLASHDVTIRQSLEPSRTVQVGEVIAQRPAPGVRIRNGSTVVLVASLGPPPVALPSVLGKPGAVAIAALDSAGFHAVAPKLLTAFSPTVPAGDTIAIYAGSVSNPESAAYGSSLELALSKGRAPIPIPRIDGLAAQVAASALQQAGFIEVVRTAFSNTVQAGYVITTEPVAKDLLQPGRRVHVVVSLGPPVTVPALGHVTLAVAERELIGAGLTVVGVHGSTSAQDWTCTPGPGTVVAKGSGVTLLAR
jgi:serine/threonine protein kinase/beta-lactam-binding protein with PASTA domain